MIKISICISHSGGKLRKPLAERLSQVEIYFYYFYIISKKNKQAENAACLFFALIHYVKDISTKEEIRRMVISTLIVL